MKLSLVRSQGVEVASGEQPWGPEPHQGPGEGVWKFEIMAALLVTFIVTSWELLSQRTQLS